MTVSDIMYNKFEGQEDVREETIDGIDTSALDWR
jgi:hypothetical protein